MHVTLLCLAVVALSFPALSDGTPLHVLSAPNLLRVGSKESIFVESQDYKGAPLNVKITVRSHPDKKNQLATEDVVLNAANDFQALVEILIAEADFADVDPKQKHFVYLEAQFPDRVLEKVVLLSFQSGYIFIQTDKTIYTPASTVRFRIFALTTKMEPITKKLQAPGQVQKDVAVSVEIMTPDNITVSMEIRNPDKGVIVGNYDILQRVSLGQWKVVCRFQSTPQKTFTSVFEVKEYVLPSFEIKLNPQKAFFYVDDDELTVQIRATYLFGKEVNGYAFAVFGVTNSEHHKTSFSSSLQRVQIRDGKGSVQLRKEHITQDIEKLVGMSIYLSVNLLTEYGGEMVEAERKGIQIVKSPYTILFQKTAKYFKPGMPFDLAIFVTNPDGSPARGVPVVVTPGDVPGITEPNGVAKITVNSVAGAQNLKITVKTNDPVLTAARQASATMTANKYNTKTNNLLHLSIDSKELDIKQNMKVNLNFGAATAIKNHDVTLLILSRGQLVKSLRFAREGQPLVSLSPLVTKDMLPSFRMVAYYHVGTNEVVADSLRVEVKVSCMGTLKVETVRPLASYRPSKQFTLKVTGDPGAKVGMVAVDKGVYVLNNEHRLTQAKIWDIVEKYDTGCTAGSGADSMGVFFDAGLVFESNTASGTGLRTDLSCPVVKAARKKRSLALKQAKDHLESPFKGLEKECCIDGMRDNTLNYTCETRSEYITDGEACKNAFLHCCKALADKKKELKHDSLLLARSEFDDGGFMEARDITSRSNFPESWLWEDYDLPACPANNANCGLQSTERPNILPDSITTWQITAISLSTSYGICVADPFEMIVLKDFFIDLKLPYAAVRNEQVEIKAVLHNYNPEELTVRVELIENKDICSSASKKGKYRQEMKIPPMTSRVVPFIIIPQVLGEQTIEVKASDNEYGIRDGILKTLRVVSEGVLTKIITNIEVDPSKHGGEQKTDLPSKIPKDIVPGTQPDSLIRITAGEQTSVLVEQAITGNSLGSLIVKPVGCGEQNMIYTTLPVIATHYLDKTNQWEKVGLDRRQTAIKFINMGYTQELYYRKTDGSYSVWRKTPSSTWLTAYVTKVFALASNLITVEKKVLCSGVKWLILNAQQPDGIFKDLGPVYHAEMLGDVRGKDTDASMTAFVLIALQEASALCEKEVLTLANSKKKAVDYLLLRLPSLTSPYAVAMTSYALANAGELKKDTLMKFASPTLNHWPVPGSHLYTLEASAYALLALVRAEAFEEAGPIVKWLNLQQKVGGGYGSTQATIMVFQAVAEYWTKAKKVDDINLSIDLDVPGRAATIKYTINNANSFLSRTSSTKNFQTPLVLKATGKGEATLTVVTLYYAKPQEDKSDCKSFDVHVELDKQDVASYEGAIATYLLKIEVLYRSNRDATMSILDIGMLTGFIADTDDLTRLSQGRDRYIEKFENDNALSERGSLIIYLNKVSYKRPDRVSFRIHKIQDVGVLQPASVSVYEYNDAKQCMKFYHPQRPGGALNRLCQKDDVCTCASESCTMQKKNGINDNVRIDKACESSADSKIDYAYKVKLDSLEQTHHTDTYLMRIEQVIKEGTDKLVQEGSLRKFVSFSFCRDTLAMQEGKSYLIMGHTKDLQLVDDDGSYQFELGENIWIEYWPNDNECKTAPEHMNTCLGLIELSKQIGVFGCAG